MSESSILWGFCEFTRASVRIGAPTREKHSESVTVVVDVGKSAINSSVALLSDFTDLSRDGEGNVRLSSMFRSREDTSLIGLFSLSSGDGTKLELM